MGQVHVVVGGQFGSEGKGHFVAQLAKKLTKEDISPCVVRTGGPNAGHTAYDKDGREWKLRHIPAAAVAVEDAPLAIAAGSEIDLDVLTTEINELEVAGIEIRNRLVVDSQATLITPVDQVIEHDEALVGSLVSRIGSTGKGVGAARSSRIMRLADLYGGKNDVAGMVNDYLHAGRSVIVEASQGYGLGLHAGWYPYCTSRDVRAIDALAEVGINPWSPAITRVIVWVVFRPNPIRVAGNSGPLHGETTWGELGLKEEFTTVTKKMRRVGTWDRDLARQAMLANGAPSSGVRPVLMFADYVDPSLAGVTDWQEPMSEIFWPFEYDLNARIWAYGTGPQTLAWRIGEK